ncbi:histidine kinase [Hyphomicrobium methylovorum]|uniref:sensor histidine kinase n=1 Tax=Hyphomicrobium methylovorum TaxID=84 RepID=UPI0015E65D71|nr:CHASE3 domain-containing protein [Hyphomicrobium methylovorum]MBA2126310.1 histidine kinase [Hyphomicrobium methylovorum]
MAQDPRRLLKITYAFGVAGLVTLIVLTAASFWFLNRTQSANNSILSSREQISSLNRLLLTVLDAETGQRGYLLTGDPEYLAPYETAITAVKERLAIASERLKADPEFNADNLRVLFDEKLAELTKTIELRKSDKLAEALSIVRLDRGRDVMDKIRETIEHDRNRLEEKLRNYIVIQSANASLARWFSLAAGLAIILTALGAIATIIKYTRELVFARSELETVNIRLEERVQERTSELKRANDEIQRFAYIVSHDLRAPLVNVMGYTSELQTSLETLSTFAEDPAIDHLPGGADAKTAIVTDMPESIGFIRTSTTKMDGLIKAILKLSREGQRVLTPETIDLNEFFESIEAGVQHRLSEKGGEFHVAKSLPSIEGDRLTLEQIFGNLVDNALKYSVPDRPPVINVRQSSARWGMTTIDIEDNGRGIAESDSDRVFDLFRRAGPQDQPGEGIGLAHVRALIRRLGGEITMTSQLGHGTTFSVTLPNKLPNLTEQQSG